MGISRTTLIREAKRILGDPLSNLGYTLEKKPYEELHEFWFIQKPNIRNSTFHIIEFAPSGFSDKNLFQMGIHLIRRNFHDPLMKPSDIPPRLELHVPLAPNLWQSGGEKFYRWHFVSLSEARKAYEDILEKLIKWGTPFLEDPGTNNELWQGWGIIWSKTKR
jgi:hypothetical protein